MAKQVINIGTTANDNTGDPIRDAFDKVNDNFTELYTDDAGDVNSVNAGTGITVNSTTGAVTVTNSAPDQTVALTGGTQISTSGTYPNFTITNDAPNATHTGEVTGSAALTIADDAIITAKILNDNVTHDKLENRYTAEVAISTLTGTVAFDFSAGSSFKLSGDLTGAYTINITNYKKGQVVTIYPLKAQSVTLTGGSGTGVFNKLGGVDYDNSATSILQIECVDDQAANPVFFYSIATFAADSTP